jgi:hypothetical protein
MAAHTKWDQPPHVSNIYWLKMGELEKIYPDYGKNGLKSAKKRIKDKVKYGRIPEPPMATPEQEPHQGQIPETGTLKNTWEVAAYDKEEGGWVTTTLSSYSHEVAGNPESGADIFEAATPAKITPTKRKRAKRLGRTLLVFGDSQIGYHRVYDQEGNDSLIPTHSEEALSIVSQLNAELMPDEIVNLSDMIDLGELARFDPKSDGFHRTLGPSFQRVHDFYAQLRADNPNAKITEVDSNHNARTQKQMLKKYPEWYGFTLPGEKYPMMSYYRLANLEPLNVDWIPGYGSAHYLYGEENGPPIIFKHGTHSSSSPGATVRKEAQQNPETHVVRGHGHSYEHMTRTNRHGQYLHYIQVGTTCQTTGEVPSYHQGVDDFGHPIKSQENWQQQAMVITDFENGQYQFDVIDIMRGVAIYRDKLYDGNNKEQ